MNAIRVLHITAHLGGGVGKVLSRLVEESARSRDGVRHTIAALEAPEKFQFADHVRAHGGKLLICPSQEELTEHIAQADVVQLEWWHHPAVAAWLGSGKLPAMRLIVWSHVSGLHVPELTLAFVAAPARFLFSSPCSWSHPRLAALDGEIQQRVDAVFSSGGFDDLPPPPERAYGGSLRVGYLGTLNFAKLHPRLLDFVSAVEQPDFRLALVGDPTTGTALLEEAARRGLSDRLELRGYRTNVAAELAGFDVLAYLLNPLHYGTTENALLEAMAMGVVPVVLNNPAERHLVRHDETGLVVNGPAEFAVALERLAVQPDERLRLSLAASRDVRERFAASRTSVSLLGHYRAALRDEKRTWDFRPIFGEAPADWFRACQGSEAWRFRDNGTVDLDNDPPAFLFEHNKGSVFHYHRVFPDDRRLADWTRSMSAFAPNAPAHGRP